MYQVSRLALPLPFFTPVYDAWVGVSISAPNITDSTAITPLNITPPHKKAPAVINRPAIEQSMFNTTGAH